MDLLNPKSRVSSHLLWLNSPICVRPGLKPRELRGFLYSRTCINKHNVLQLSSKFVFIIFNENANQQHLKYLSFLLFLYNFFQIFLQYMYLFSAVIGLKVGIIAWKALGRDCTNNNGLLLQIGCYHPKL